MVPMREIGPADTAVRKEGVPSENFLKKCHVEHKRIGRVTWNRAKFKFHPSQGEVAGIRSQ